MRSTLQNGASSLPERNILLKDGNTKKVKIAAVGDIHVGRAGWGPYTDLFTEISERADILLLCGDITNRGLPSEAELLVSELQSCRIPIGAVLGNHEYEHGQQDEIKHILSQHKVILLDDEPFILRDVGFAGVKGAGGGFGQHMLAPFGEETLKVFAREASNEALRLEGLLSQLETPKKVTVMHYAPIRETVIGENPEIFPFLGSSHLMEPLDTYNVTISFHGHAHRGTHAGKTMKGVPVYNVSYPIMQQINPKTPYALIEV
jgi:Icc-related predicted phosphoesterase